MTVGEFHCGSVVMSPARIHKDVDSIPGLAVSWTVVEAADEAWILLLWLWHRPAAVAPIQQPLAWELHMPQVRPLKKKKIFYNERINPYPPHIHTHLLLPSAEGYK